MNSHSYLTLCEWLKGTGINAKACKNRRKIINKVSALLNMGGTYSHAFICHLLLIYRILCFNLELFISHKAAMLTLVIPKLLHHSLFLYLSVIVRGIVRMQLSSYLRKIVRIQFSYYEPMNLSYEPLQTICTCLGFFHQHDSIVQCAIPLR